jgi:aminopeptidase
MTDPRWMQLADILVNYSTRVQQGEKAFITMMEAETQPLTVSVYSKVVQAGGLPQVEFVSAYLERELMLHGSMEQIEWVPQLQAYGMEWADVYIGLRGARNPHEFDGITPERMKAHRQALGQTSAMRIDLTRWVLVRVPNESFAQAAGTSLDTMMEFFFSATLRDWKEEARRYYELKEVFEAAEKVRIVGVETDITFSTRGRRYVVGDGTLNMPDGEIYTAPVDDSAEGTVYFEFPGVSGGRLIPGIQLEFAGGKVIKASAEDNEDLLHQLIDMDEGARRIGEFGVGTNFGIDRYTYDILYDEKIGGTIHLALGRAYKECGGVNQSALHWDIVKDLRQAGAIYLDDRKVFENGRFLV